MEGRRPRKRTGRPSVPCNPNRANTAMEDEGGGSRDLRNSRRQSSLAKRLGEAVNEAMQKTSRRFACISCAAIYEEGDVVQRGPFPVGNVIGSEGGDIL